QSFRPWRRAMPTCSSWAPTAAAACANGCWEARRARSSGRLPCRHRCRIRPNFTQLLSKRLVGLAIFCEPCLQGRFQAEAVECATLDGGGRGEHREGGGAAEADGVAGEGRQISHQG